MNAKKISKKIIREMMTADDVSTAKLMEKHQKPMLKLKGKIKI